MMVAIETAMVQVAAVAMTTTGTAKQVMATTMVAVETNMAWTAKTVIIPVTTAATATATATTTATATATVQRVDQEDMGAVEGRRRMT